MKTYSPLSTVSTDGSPFVCARIGVQTGAIAIRCGATEIEEQFMGTSTNVRNIVQCSFWSTVKFRFYDIVGQQEMQREIEM